MAIASPPMAVRYATIKPFPIRDQLSFHKCQVMQRNGSNPSCSTARPGTTARLSPIQALSPPPPRGHTRTTRQGARAVASIADACREGAVITMLANDNAVEGVVLGKGGIIDSLPRGGIHISSSTISVALSEALAKVHGKAGQRFVAAPVFGRPDV